MSTDDVQDGITRNLKRDRILLMLLMFSFYGSMGILFPYLPLNLSKQLSTDQIGILMATGPFIMLICQPFWGWLSDRWSIRNVMFCTLGVSIVSSLGFLFVSGFIPWLILISIYFMFQNPVAMLIDTTALLRYSDRFGRIRLWGSIGFGAAVFCGGFVVGDQIIWIHFSLLLVSFLLIMLLKPSGSNPADDPDAKARLNRAKGGVFILLRNPALLLLLFFLFFTAVAMKGNYTFYSIGLNMLEAPGWLLGTAWLLQVIPEIWFFLWADRLAKKITPLKIALVGTIVYVFQFSLLGWFPELWVWTLFQPLISLSYCFWYVGGIHTVKRLVPVQYQATGQSLYSATCYGLGGVTGSLFSGMLVGNWNLFGFYKIAGMLCLVTATGLWIVIRMNLTERNVHRELSRTSTVET